MIPYTAEELIAYALAVTGLAAIVAAGLNISKKVDEMIEDGIDGFDGCGLGDDECLEDEELSGLHLPNNRELAEKALGLEPNAVEEDEGCEGKVVMFTRAPKRTLQRVLPQKASTEKVAADRAARNSSIMRMLRLRKPSKH